MNTAYAFMIFFETLLDARSEIRVQGQDLAHCERLHKAAGRYGLKAVITECDPVAEQPAPAAAPDVPGVGL